MADIDLSALSSCSCCSSSSSASGGGCCGGAIPATIYATFSNVSGCPNVNGLVITLTNSGGTGWNLGGASGGSGGCNFVTFAAFDCTTGAFSVAFGADNTGGGSPLTYSCSPFQATYRFTLTFVADMTCCAGTVDVTLTA